MNNFIYQNLYKSQQINNLDDYSFIKILNLIYSNSKNLIIKQNKIN
jgi:hypothetical protein